MSKYSDEQLDMIELMASLFFEVKDIALNIEVDPNKLEVDIQNTNSPVAKRYIKGALSTEIELRKAIKESALAGSSPSQNIFINYSKRFQYA